jgi:hypothetical protein
MRRRSLFGLAAGAVASLFVPRAAAKPIDHTKPDRDANGSAICRIYRKAGDGQWREIRTSDVKAGDTLICIGQDGDRLWMAESMGVERVFPPHNGDTGGVSIKPGTFSELAGIRHHYVNPAPAPTK